MEQLPLVAVLSWGQQILTVSIKMFSFKWKLKMRPCPRLCALLSVSHVSLTLPVIPFLTARNSAAEESPKLGKKLQKCQPPSFHWCVCGRTDSALSSFGYSTQFLLLSLVVSIVLIWVEYCEIFWLGQRLVWVGYVGCSERRGEFLIHSVPFGRHRCLQHTLRSATSFSGEVSSTSSKHQKGETVLT